MGACPEQYQHDKSWRPVPNCIMFLTSSIIKFSIQHSLQCEWQQPNPIIYHSIIINYKNCYKQDEHI